MPPPQPMSRHRAPANEARIPDECHAHWIHPVKETHFAGRVPPAAGQRIESGDLRGVGISGAASSSFGQSQTPVIRPVEYVVLVHQRGVPSASTWRPATQASLTWRREAE